MSSLDALIEQLRTKLGAQRAVAACSGGVDSTTAACLAYKALGQNLMVAYIDDGFRRESEPQQVIKLLTQLGLNVQLIDASQRFYQALRGIQDPEQKRKAFRHTFYSVLGEFVQQQGARFLIQGTIKADIDETAGGIKTQHNVLEQIGIDPRSYGFELVEPLKDLYKPQVRIPTQARGDIAWKLLHDLRTSDLGSEPIHTGCP